MTLITQSRVCQTRGGKWTSSRQLLHWLHITRVLSRHGCFLTMLSCSCWSTNKPGSIPELWTPGGSIYSHMSVDTVLPVHTHCWPAPRLFPCSGSRSSKTFKPKKNIPEGSHQYELLKHAEATLGSGNLRQAVMLPEGEDLNEWIAVNSKWMSTAQLNIQEPCLCIHTAFVKSFEHLHQLSGTRAKMGPSMQHAW